MVAPILLNLPAMGQFLGHVPHAELVVKARQVDADAPPGFLRLEPERMTNTTRRVAMETLVGCREVGTWRAKWRHRGLAFCWHLACSARGWRDRAGGERLAT